ncbi:hypothetical protein DQ04_02501000 [Trypanosoma grayi]|uniref:hypothetical protein n=1 Tax=Trypanosoma grayi TaxID=71804 RepID=UPI0004F4B267|nr:hypothetical protein DQ04_02501000 [Trypanosoma grayi]KEG11552.1 hypothetical protein DQ04_02501000 [Trypanosoma grayi]
MPHPTLLDIGVEAYSHQAEVDELRRRLGIKHNHFDCWLYGFLENKNFDIGEAVKKLNRRDVFEKEQLAKYTVTDWMVQSMRKGIMQLIGNDKQGRVVFYVVTARDKPTSARREECKMNFDMMVSYGTRLRAENKRCQMALLVNQEKASLWSNTDMTLQADIALRIAKFYPGAVDKMYICNMNRTLAAVAKPVFARFPPIVSDRIIIFSEGDRKAGKLLEYFDESVLPVALGGSNNCDNEENHINFSVTIKEHFDQLKAAVQRGYSVKEWELECLFPHGLPEETSVNVDLFGNTPPPLAPDGASFGDGNNNDVSWSDVSRNSNDNSPIRAESVDLLTCDSFNHNSNYHTRVSSVKEGVFPIRTQSCTMRTMRRDFVTDYVEQFVMMESFFRGSIMEAHEREWLMILQRESPARRSLREAEENLGRNTMLFRRLPAAVQLIAKGGLWITLMVTSLYFLLATIFGAMIGCSCMMFFFFSMLSKPYNVFLYGCALLVTGCQTALFCSRGFELTRRTYDGRLIDAFRGLGFHALIVQASLCFAAVVAFFVVFCVIAAQQTVVDGVQYTVAVGWIVAFWIILLYHFLYAFGFIDSTKRSRRGKMAVATLYFFFDVDMDSDHAAMRHSASTEVTITCISMLSAFAFGLCHMLNGAVFFLCATVIMSVVTMLLVVQFINVDHAPSTGGLLLSALLYTSVVWLYIVFTISAHGWNDEWSRSTSVVLCLALLTNVIVLGYSWVPLSNTVMRRWVFRGAWMWVILHLVTCIIAMFATDYRLGLFILGFSIHLLLYGFRVNSGSSTYGVWIVVMGFLAMLLACILLGGLASGQAYSSPASEWLLPNYATGDRRANAIAAWESPPESLTPVCWLRFPTTIDIVGMALFAKLSYAEMLNTTRIDLQRWFPSFTYVGNRTYAPSSFLQVKIFTGTDNNLNITIITLGSTSALYAAMDSMTMWIDFMALSLFAVFTPHEWFMKITSSLDVVERLSSLLWLSSVEEARSDMADYFASMENVSHHVYVVGYGLSGATAAVVVPPSSQRVQGVMFASPVNAVAQRGEQQMTLGLPPNRVLSLVTTLSVLTPWWVWGPLTETLPCGATASDCSNIGAVAELLDGICQGGKAVNKFSSPPVDGRDTLRMESIK